MTYLSERRYFQALRDNCPPGALDEYLQAVSVTIEQYNTTIRENRFIVGGAVEIYTVALMRASGIDVKGHGAEMDSSDLTLPNGKPLSVKSQFTKNKTKFKLINTQSDYEPKWTTATLFIIAGIGIVYGDPDMTNPEHLVRASDALELKFEAIRSYMADSKNIIELNIPVKPPAEMTRFSLKASSAVASKVLYERKLEILRRQME